jgi:hypothetical protein
VFPSSEQTSMYTVLYLRKTSQGQRCAFSSYQSPTPR